MHSTSFCLFKANFASDTWSGLRQIEIFLPGMHQISVLFNSSSSGSTFWSSEKEHNAYGCLPILSCVVFWPITHQASMSYCGCKPCCQGLSGSLKRNCIEKNQAFLLLMMLHCLLFSQAGLLRVPAFLHIF